MDLMLHQVDYLAGVGFDMALEIVVMYCGCVVVLDEFSPLKDCLMWYCLLLC